MLVYEVNTPIMAIPFSISIQVRSTEMLWVLALVVIDVGLVELVPVESFGLLLVATIRSSHCFKGTTGGQGI